jgi:hypothetical protein
VVWPRRIGAWGAPAVWVVAAGCLGPAHSPTSRPGDGSGSRRSVGQGRPSLTVIAREGDARGGLAVAGATDGIGPDRGALVGVSLAALVQRRLAISGIEATAIGGWDGWRVRALVASPAQAEATFAAMRAALLTPVSEGEPALGAVSQRAAALASRPRATGALLDVVRCTGEAYASGADAPPSLAEIEAWRAASIGFGRVAVAVAGGDSIADAVEQALTRGGPWPRGSPLEPPPRSASDARSLVFDASGDVEPGGARIVLTARTRTAERAAAAAAILGDAHGPLASRLAALEAPARLRSVTATAHVDGGCLAETLDLDARSLSVDVAARIATAASLARQETVVELADVAPEPDLGRSLATRAADPRDAAERAAWWALAGQASRPDDGTAELELLVGLATAKDAAQPAAFARSDEIRREIDRTTLAWHVPVVEARTRVERGQGEVWVLLASPCGTSTEGAGDAGLDAAVALSAALQSVEMASDVQAEPYVSSEGVGVLVHGANRPGEAPTAQARRLADVAARAFAGEAPSPAQFTRARTLLLLHASEDEARAMDALASALSPGHPSWVLPAGTAMGLASASDDSLKMRAGALRAGPLRVAVLANVDGEQANAAVRAVDRWIARRPGESRACPAVASLPSPRPGTYSVDRPGGALSEAILAIGLPPRDRGALASATWFAAALAGPDGLLARSTSSGDAARTGDLKWNAEVVGAPLAPGLAIRLQASDGAIDAGVARARAIIEKLRLEGPTADDWSRASSAVSDARLAASLQPRQRVVDLWLSQSDLPTPSLDTLRAFAASVLRDDSLLVIAARPPRVVDPPARAAGARDPRSRSRAQGSP